MDNVESLLRCIRLGSKASRSLRPEALRRIADAALLRSCLPLACDPRWIAEELGFQPVPVDYIAVRAGEAPRLARLEGDRILYQYDSQLRQRSWHLYVGIGMRLLARHPLAHSMPAAWSLGAFLALPDAVLDETEETDPRQITSFLPVPIIEARMTASYRSGIQVASLA